MQRKLTAILSADVVGYSSLMEADETGTLARLKGNRSLTYSATGWFAPITTLITIGRPWLDVAKSDIGPF